MGLVRIGADGINFSPPFATHKGNGGAVFSGDKITDDKLGFLPYNKGKSAEGVPIGAPEAFSVRDAHGSTERGNKMGSAPGLEAAVFRASIIGVASRVYVARKRTKED